MDMVRSKNGWSWNSTGSEPEVRRWGQSRMPEINMAKVGEQASMK